MFNHFSTMIKKDFMTLNSWLGKFKKNHDIAICLKTSKWWDKYVYQDSVEEWKQNISILIAGYEAKEVKIQ